MLTEKEIIEKYNDSHTFAVGFSGGKDSTATLIHLIRVLKLKNVVACFADTAWEAKETYEYLDYIEEAMGCEIVRLQAKCGQVFVNDNPKVPDKERPLTFEELVRIKGRFPSAINKFCTTELKLKVQQEWIRGYGKPIIAVSGVRREESPKRRNASYFNTDDEWMGVPVWLPIVDWTWQEVFALHDEHGIKPNPLYKQGFKRVGCFPCVNACSAELKQMAMFHSGRYDEIHELEKEVESSFWHNSKVPPRYRRWKDNIASALDVREYALGKPADNNTGDFFSDEDFDDIEAPACNSIYGLCE